MLRSATLTRGLRSATTTVSTTPAAGAGDPIGVA